MYIMCGNLSQNKYSNYQKVRPQSKHEQIWLLACKPDFVISEPNKFEPKEKYFNTFNYERNN